MAYKVSAPASKIALEYPPAPNVPSTQIPDIGFTESQIGVNKTGICGDGGGYD